MGDKLSRGVGTIYVGSICALNVKTYVKTTIIAIVNKSTNTYYEYLNSMLMPKIGVSFPLSAIIRWSVFEITTSIMSRQNLK